jgi:hypothetical protein
MRKRTALIAGVVALGGALVLASFAIADSGNNFDAKRMSGSFEVPVASSGASGTFEASLDGSTLNYTLTYSDLETPVTQSHIHVAQKFVSGGISVWLCGTATNPGPAGTPSCGPAGSTSGTVTDSFVAADIIGPTTQAVPAGSFDELISLMRAGLTYANVHSQGATPGEVRGQIGGGGEGGDD